jgi:hypothetical protein
LLRYSQVAKLTHFGETVDVQKRLTVAAAGVFHRHLPFAERIIRSITSFTKLGALSWFANLRGILIMMRMATAMRIIVVPTLG